MSKRLGDNDKILLALVMLTITYTSAGLFKVLINTTLRNGTQHIPIACVRM